jgi:hypothetical protein
MPGIRYQQGRQITGSQYGKCQQWSIQLHACFSGKTSVCVPDNW